ncbi:MAG: glycosyltransferase involved in cell wall biosynthesis [Paracoccaceae bacterium]|jgi:glycosyltransferase involved in cell wall biosynthesis
MTRTKMRVAIIHYWLVGMRGGERVLEQICMMFPDADIYTHACVPENISPLLRRHKITETFIARMPGGRKHYQKYLPLMPRALEELDLTGYDLVISSESGPAKGVIVPPDAVHLCYCHSPMRYIWDQYHAYKAGQGLVARLAFSAAVMGLRTWDTASAQRVDRIVANSQFVARRVRRSWGREASVVHPPVDLDAYRPGPSGRGDFYLFLSELAPYKRADLAIEAVRGTDRRLKVVGSGSERARLEATAPSNVEFLGRAADGQMAELYQSCRALLFPGIEDFGIVPLEAMACGRPVIALGRGGALDTVIDGETGVLFDDQSPEGLRAALDRFEADLEDTLDPARIVRHAAGFGAAAFRTGLADQLRLAAPHLPLDGIEFV